VSHLIPSKSTSASSSTTLIAFVTLRNSPPRRLDVAPGTPKCVVESREVCITLLFIGIDSEELNLMLVIVQGGLRVESNPTLCGHLNRDIGAFVVLNFRNKSLSLVPCSYLLS
jgi:hypothetical protein